MQANHKIVNKRFINVSNLKAENKVEELKLYIYKQLINGTLKKGDRLLSETALAKQVGLGLKTVRRALTELEQEGLIRKIHRVGTFINDTLKAKKNIAIIIFDIVEITNLYCREILRGISNFLDPEQYSLQIYPINARKLSMQKHILEKLLVNNEIDGILLLSWLEPEEIKRLIKINIPFVLVGFEYKTIQAPTVIQDFENPLKQMLRYLSALGHEYFGIICGHLEAEGVEHIMNIEAKIKKMLPNLKKVSGVKSCKFKTGIYSKESASQLTKELLRSKHNPTVILSFGEVLTGGVIETINSMPEAVKNKIIVAPCVENITDFPKPLIRNPLFEIGMISAELLIRQIKNKKVEITKKIIQPEFVL